jgi:hypothetical protein
MSLPIKKLSEESRSFNIREASENAQKAHILSTIEITAPSIECLKLLLKYFPKPYLYKISYLEIARDTFYQTKEEAISALSALLAISRKKYSSSSIYDWYLMKPKKKRKVDPDIFSDWTGYYGNNNFKYVIYGRFSKIDRRPCVHDEWRIKRTSFVKRKTGISSIDDLLRFDFQAFFEKQDKQFIVYEEIDMNKLGRWLLGWQRRKNLSRRQEGSVDIAAQTFCNQYNIINHAALVSYFMNKKAEIKKGIKDASGKRVPIRGRRTDWEKKILSIRDYGKFQAKSNKM